MTLKRSFSLSYLLLGLEHITAEHIALSISGNVAEDLQILRVMRHVEDPKRKENRSETKKVNEMQNNNKTWQAFKMHLKMQNGKQAYFSGI